MRGIRFTHKLLGSTQVSNDQKQLIQMSDACERQMIAILETANIGSIEDGCQELNMVVFLLENVINAVISQVMIFLVEKDMHGISKEIGSLSLYGDQIRLQQVLSDFLMHVVHHTQSSEGSVEIRVDLISKLIRDGHDFVHLQFRMIHPGQGLPLQIVQEMFQGGNKLVSQEGFGLRATHKILRNMGGHAQYIRDPSRLVNATFSLTLNFKPLMEQAWNQ
ncbi:Phytochrome [Thalictrum thalictroides]|uniref:Phytochrome n=1 Tax=Thalictrum thalictroides TaxID=46969 RepID=A0A7J6W9B2_THATH|nr:Phytochrome [Thalictrum thalictroides]